jgi:S-DNA-T family DNA segregation ATPase FtsK/SpoIIIE
LRKSIFVFIFALIFYFFVSTLLPSVSTVGKFGEFLGNANFKLFAYLSYFFPVLIAVYTYLAYKKRFDSSVSIKVLGTVFIYFDFLLIQAMVCGKGVVGSLFVFTLQGLIGVVGVSLLVFVIFLWGLFLLFEDRVLKFFQKRREDAPADKPVVREADVVTDFDTDVSNIELGEEDVKNGELRIENEELRIENEKSGENSSSEKSLEHTDDRLAVSNETQPSVLNPESPDETVNVKHVEELEDTKKLLSQIETGEREKPKNWKFPPLNFLSRPNRGKKEINEAEIDKKIKILIEKLKQFKIEGDVVRYYVGPVVTTFEFKPLPHIKVSKILALQDDLAMALKAQSIRIQAPIPGKDVVGIEIPNEKVETIYLREILESDIFQNAKSPLTLAVGKDIVGVPFVTDLKKLPHLLIAGTTGSGKSVGINAMILSLLYRNSPDELKFLMVDPKMLEFSIFNDIPHLLTPVITEPKKAIMALNSMVKEMERRYKLMAKARVKNIEGYNQKVSSAEKMPYIVIIIDELADLMMTSGKDVEYSIARLAQMARASGIHLIVATQRPSVDVVTGLIKANLPSRISFKVGQKIDSKVILDQFGAESLLGRGDMLFTPPGITGLIRLHAPFTSEEEIEKVVEYLKSQRTADYDTMILNTMAESEMLEEIEDLDELYEEAKEIILKEKRTSISYLQRRLNIGYNRAANIIEQMEQMGVLSAPNAKGQREILIS